jgi:gamma-glutamylcyclotransferase (GGCT)/AIG2-like uncharacterized protein YtfP
MHNTSVLLFVYGTLLRGEANHVLLHPAAFCGTARTEAAFELVDLGEFPAMLEGGSNSVHGELWEVPSERMGTLDALEDAPRTYRRVAMRLADDRTAETYLYNAGRLDRLPRIPSGDWRAHAGRK